MYLNGESFSSWNGKKKCPCHFMMSAIFDDVICIFKKWVKKCWHISKKYLIYAFIMSVYQLTFLMRGQPTPQNILVQSYDLFNLTPIFPKFSPEWAQKANGWCQQNDHTLVMQLVVCWLLFDIGVEGQPTGDVKNTVGCFLFLRWYLPIDTHW